MATNDFSLALAPVEDLYGGGSRTRHVVLKRRSASLAMSTFSCPIFEKIAPNRDYPYEGLSCLVDGENWKFADTVAIGLRQGDRYVTLKPGDVHVSPWDCEFSYSGEGLRLKAGYYLFEVRQGCLGEINVRVEGEGADDTTIVFEPYFDLRFMYAPPAIEGLAVRQEADRLAVASGDATMVVEASEAKWVRKGRTIEWKYKLGTGNRCWLDGHLRFVPEQRPVRSFYDIEVRAAEASLRFAAAENGKQAVELLASKPARDDIGRAETIRQALFPNYGPGDRDVLFRALGLDRFGMYSDGTMFHEAGDFWFRSVWFRDEFEGLINSYQACKAINGTDAMARILRRSFALQDEYGRVPNRLVPGTGGIPDYNSADSTLLAFILAGKLVRDGGDAGLAVEAAAAFRKFMHGVARCEVAANGPPRLRPNGLICVPAWHSWIDGMRKVEGTSVPIRVDEEWERELVAAGAAGEFDLQKFFLPEINALWMRALEAGWLFCRYDRDFKLADRCKDIYNRAREGFRSLFLNPDTGFLNNLTTSDSFALGCKTDPRLGSPGVVAAAVLGTEVFTLRELLGVTAVAKNRLLRTKWGLPFGILVRGDGRDVYLGDPEYHESVVWPRDTPYLIRLLRICGDEATVDGLLRSNLKHQMEEGFVFFNQELFSPDHDLTPVKNPVQWWSQWLDPYLEKRPP